VGVVFLEIRRPLREEKKNTIEHYKQHSLFMVGESASGQQGNLNKFKNLMSPVSDRAKTIYVWTNRCTIRFDDDDVTTAVGGWRETFN